MEGNIVKELLERAGIEVGDIYATPLVGCRPVTHVPATAERPAHVADRDPTKAEIQACHARISELIYRVDPMLIFGLGPLVWRTLVHGADRLVHRTFESALGEVCVTRVDGRVVKQMQYDVMPLLSVKQLIQSPSEAPHGAVTLTINNLKRGKRYVEWLAQTEVQYPEACGVEPAHSAEQSSKTKLGV
jgi:uracil-DNA glycosylase family 4